MKVPKSQLLLPLFQKAPRKRYKLPVLFKQGQLAKIPENMRRLRCSLAWVGRKLLFNDRQMLLHSDGEYWIAQPRLDCTAVENRLWGRLKRDTTSQERTLLELQVAEERQLISRESLQTLKASIFTSKLFKTEIMK